MTIGERFPEVLLAAQRGDEGAITQLYREANPGLLRFLSARAPAVADDLAANVWLAVAEQLPRFRGDESAWKGYLFTIARRQIADHWRREARRRTSPVEPGAFFEEAAATDSANDGLRRVRDAELVALVVSHLSADQADVVLLRLVAGLDLDVVAQIMGKTIGNVRVIQHRAVKRLAAVLNPVEVMP